MEFLPWLDKSGESVRQKTQISACIPFYRMNAIWEQPRHSEHLLILPTISLTDLLVATSNVPLFLFLDKVTIITNNVILPPLPFVLMQRPTSAKAEDMEHFILSALDGYCHQKRFSKA